MEMNEMRIEAQDLNQQAAVLIQANSIEAAKEKLDKAIDLDPMLMDSYKNYGDLYMTIQEYENAKNMYKKAILVEKKGELYFLYGNACFMMDNPHEGLEYYNLAISEGFDNEDMLFFMGMAYEHMNDDTMALRYYHKASLKNPSRPDYVIKTISAQVRLGLLDEAEANADELVLNSPELFDGYHIKTQLLINKGDYEEAVKFSKKAADRFPEDADLMFDYIKCLSLKGDRAESLMLIDQAKRMKHFDDAKRDFTLLEGQINAEMGNIEKAIECCKACVELEDGYFDGEARFTLLNLYLVQKDYEKIIEGAEKIIENNAEDSYYNSALYYKANALNQLGSEDAVDCYKNAMAIYRLATLQDPTAYEAYMYRAMCHKDLEEFDKAIELLDFLKSLNEDIAEIYLMKADIYEQLGKHSVANEELEKAYSLKPELRPVGEKEE